MNQFNRDFGRMITSVVMGNNISGNSKIVINGVDITAQVKAPCKLQLVTEDKILFTGDSSNIKLELYNCNLQLVSATAGDINIIYDGSKGKIGGNVTTASGDVKIKNGTVNGSVWTVSGDIEVKGHVLGNATSMSGDIKYQKNYDH